MKLPLCSTVVAGALAACILALALAGCSSSTNSGGDTPGTNGKDGAAMVWVPAGAFLMGSTTLLMGSPDEVPQRTVTLKGYWIYKYDVTVAQYRAFCKATGRALPDFPTVYSWAGKSGWDDPALQQHPIVNVGWFDAQDYAAWAGVHLPTEAQWEKAARGTDGRNYPWGGLGKFADGSFDGWDPSKCVNSFNSVSQGISTWPVGSFPTGASPYGAMDMAGEVWQWCADWYGPYDATAVIDPIGATPGGNLVLRGGSWYDYGNYGCGRCALRNYNGAGAKEYNIGFRCVSTSPGP